MIRVPVISPSGEPLMPTKPSRCRRWLRDGKAKVVYNGLGIFCIKLTCDPSGYNTQDIVVGIDPGKDFTGVGVQTTKTTLFSAHLELPFRFVKRKMKSRSTLRRSRRGRRINRKVTFKNRNHRQKRFNNRKGSKLPPSIKANRLFELRVVKELIKLFPISHIVYEIIKAKGNSGFSPVMVGQRVMISWLEEICPVETKLGFETHNLREYLGLPKDKEDKSRQTRETHANDGITLACSHFLEYKRFQNYRERGHYMKGECIVTKSPFAILARPKLFRRQLHFENPNKKPNPNQIRKRKGGTTTPFGFRKGDLVTGVKANKTYRGWIGGYTDCKTAKNLSLYDINWNLIGQFIVSKVKLIQKRTNILVEYPKN